VSLRTVEDCGTDEAFSLSNRGDCRHPSSKERMLGILRMLGESFAFAPRSNKRRGDRHAKCAACLRAEIGHAQYACLACLLLSLAKCMAMTYLSMMFYIVLDLQGLAPRAVIKRWISNCCPESKTCARNIRETKRKIKKVVIINRDRDKMTCQGGTSTVARRVNIVTGAVSGKRLKAVAKTPLG